MLVCAFSLLLVSIFGQAAKEAGKKADNVVLLFQWKDGLRLTTADGRFEVQIGGRIHNDWTVMEAAEPLTSQFGEMTDGTEFRRARVSLSGVTYENVEFKAQFDFATGDAAFRDVYVGLRKLKGIGNIRFGQFKEPFGLEEQTSSNFITFMERSLANAFVPSRHTGIMIHDRELGERISWAAGVFKDTNDFGIAMGDENWAVTGRVTAVSWFADEGRRLLHLGVAYSRRNIASSFRFRERPEAHLAPRFVDTGVFPAEALNLIGTEAALVYGPTSIQAEYIRADTELPNGVGRTGPTLGGFYVLGSVFLTGENRSYRPSDAAFSRVRPRSTFPSREDGTGAWEVGVRYSKVDLNDGPVTGGVLKDLTAGLNWYLNANSRIMWNYVRAALEGRGAADILQMRFQVDF